MKLSIYMNLFLYKFGGTEGYTANLIEVLQNIYPAEDITIITENFNGRFHINVMEYVKNQNAAYGLKINPEKISLIPLNLKEKKVNENSPKILRIIQFLQRQNNFFRIQRKISNITKNHDLFINCSRYTYYGNAKKNIAIIHFPKEKLSKIPINKKLPFLAWQTKRQDYKFENNIDLYIPNSKFTAYWLSQYWNIPSKKISVIYPPVTSVKKTTNIKKNQILICSRIDSTKKIDILIKAFLKSEYLSKKCKLIIAGSIKEENPEYIKYLETLSADIQFYFEPTREKLEELYAESKIYWHAKGIYEEDPLYFEHFGITTVEAMTAGCIPIVINKGGQKEIVDENCGLRWNDVEELVNMTVELLENNTLIEKLKSNSLKKSSLFLKDKFTEKLKEIL